MKQRTRARVNGLVVTVLALGAVAFGVSLPSASATDPSGPSVMSPGPGSVVQDGFAGPFAVDMTGAPAGTYGASVSCRASWPYPSADEQFPHFTWDGVSGPSRTFELVRPLDGPTDCRFAVVRGPGSTDEATVAAQRFSVDDPPLEVTYASLWRRTFYPVVDDGYLDETSVSFWFSRPAEVTKTVVDEHGRTVLTGGPYSFSYGEHPVTWDGRDAHEHAVAPGTYTIVVRASDTEGTVRTVRRKVEVATEVRPSHDSVVLSGGHLSSGRGCTATLDGATTRLVCHHGTFAQARFGVRLPASAHHLDPGLDGRRLAGDSCCRGTVTEKVDRPSRRRAVVTVRVTGSRAYVIDGAGLWFEYRRRY